MVVLLGCKRMLQVTFRGEMEGKVLKTPLAIFAFSQLHVKELYIDAKGDAGEIIKLAPLH